MFYVIAVISLIWAISLPTRLSQYTRGTQRSEPGRARPTFAELTRTAPSGQLNAKKAAQRCRGGCSFKHPNMWGLDVRILCRYLYCLWIFLSWLPSYLVTYRRLLTLLQMGSFWGWLGAGVFGDIFGGWFTDFLLVKDGESQSLPVVSLAIMGMLGCGAFILPAAFTKSPTIAADLLRREPEGRG